MAEVFLTSDTHWGHIGVCKFVMADGTKCRPWDDPEKMNEDMIDMWNKTVGPKDKVYHLGDVVINRRFLSLLWRLNGDQILIKGNHDIFRLEEYTPFFRDIRGSHVMNGMILTHIPVHESNLYRFGTNIHGHTHTNKVMMTDRFGVTTVDPRYHCVCVEQTDFRPISFEDVIERVKAQGGTVGFKNGNGPTM